MSSRTSNPDSHENLLAATDRLSQALETLHLRTTSICDRGFIYHSVVQKNINDSKLRMEARGPLLSVDLVVLTFDCTSHVRQLQALVFVAANVMRNTCIALRQALERKDLSTYLVQLRTLVERIAHVRHITRAIQKEKLFAEDEKDLHPFEKTFHLDADIEQALYGTTVNWNVVLDKPLADMDPNADMGRGLSKLGAMGHLFALWINKKIEDLDKEMPGTSACYGLLCEFLHPNAGDFF
jgi:hypothetical protein